jgi:hypothetical protein
VPEDVVWISEDEDPFEPEGGMLLGTFSGHLDRGGSAPADRFEGLPVEEAIAWGRARAERVYLRFGRSGYYSAGARKSREFPAWPPPDLPPLARRRPPGEEWRDRTEADEPIPWRVDVHLIPPDWATAELARERAVHAPTQASAIEQGLARCSVPDRWTIGASARPEAFR